MSAMSDAIITYAILRKFTTPVKETPAFKAGLVDEDGKPTKKSTLTDTESARDAYTLLDRLVFKLKRMWKSMPTFAKLIGGYATALAFIKEDVDEHDFGMFEHLDPSAADHWGSVLLGESIVSFDQHVIIQIAEDASQLRKLVEAYENSCEDQVCEELAAATAPAMSGNAVSTGQVQGLATEPVIQPKVQKKWTRSNGRKIEDMLP